MSRPATRLALEPLDFTALRAELLRFRTVPRRLPNPGTAPRPGSRTRPATRAPAGVAVNVSELTPDAAIAELVARSQAGEGEAFGLLYDRYVDVVYRYIYYRVANPTLAEDLVSETFLRALRRIDTFTWQGRDFAAWLVTIARNLIADHFKSGRYRLEITTDDLQQTGRTQTTDGPESAVLDSLTNATLLEAVKQLNPEQQECVVLRFLQGMSVAETARAMGKNDGAIKALQYRAVKALARTLPAEAVR